MTTPSAIAAWVDERLDAPRFRENEPENGLVVDAGVDVSKVASSVNTTFDSIAAAAAAGAQLLVVHHPTWSYIDLDLHARKLDLLRSAGLSLYGAHASLDGAETGTAASLAELLGITIDGRFARYEGALAGIHGRWAGGWDELCSTVGRRLGIEPELHRWVDACARVGIVTGAGGLTSWLEEAQQLGCDTYLTGEGSMYTRLFAREAGINLILGGHDATETPGIERLGQAIAERFGLLHECIREPHIG